MTIKESTFYDTIQTAEAMIASKGMKLGETVDLKVYGNHILDSVSEHPRVSSVRLSRTMGLPNIAYHMYNTMTESGLFKMHAKLDDWRIGHFIHTGIAFSGYFLVKRTTEGFYTLEVVLEEPMPLGSKVIDLEIPGFIPMACTPMSIGFVKQGASHKSGSIIMVEESWRQGIILRKLKLPNIPRNIISSFLDVKEFTMAPMSPDTLIKAMMVYSFRDMVNVMDKEVSTSDDIGVSHVSYMRPDGREMNFVGIDYRLA